MVSAASNPYRKRNLSPTPAFYTESWSCAAAEIAVLSLTAYLLHMLDDGRNKLVFEFGMNETSAPFAVLRVSGWDALAIVSQIFLMFSKCVFRIAGLSYHSLGALFLFFIVAGNQALAAAAPALHSADPHTTALALGSVSAILALASRGCYECAKELFMRPLSLHSPKQNPRRLSTSLLVFDTPTTQSVAKSSSQEPEDLLFASARQSPEMLCQEVETCEPEVQGQATMRPRRLSSPRRRTDFGSLRRSSSARVPTVHSPTIERASLSLNDSREATMEVPSDPEATVRPRKPSSPRARAAYEAVAQTTTILAPPRRRYRSSAPVPVFAGPGAQ
ncbi:unnamed protein product [Peniophora sp. CBMAI 1063]|nr:unnamed protein product [Peniophora sp. CBMAI 1063]